MLAKQAIIIPTQATLFSIIVFVSIWTQECFNSPYGTQYFKEYSEKIPGDTTSKLSQVAKELKIYLIGGTIPEEEGGKYYNTCTVYDPSGNMIAKHRKVYHLKLLCMPDFELPCLDSRDANRLPAGPWGQQLASRESGHRGCEGDYVSTSVACISRRRMLM